MRLSELQVTAIRRIVLSRRTGRGGTRTLSSRKDIAHFIRNHADDEVEESCGRMCSVRPGVDYVSIVLCLFELENANGTT